MQEENGLVFLDRVAQNQLQAMLLPWVVLMLHGQKASTAKAWARLCRERLGEAAARELAALAWNFCELTDCRAVWHPYLEPFLVQESIFLREARAEGRIQSQREALSKLLRAKLQGDSLWAALALAEQQTDLATLTTWFDSALTLPPEAILPELLR